MSEPVEHTPETTRPEPSPELAPVQEQLIRVWDGVRFEDEPAPEPTMPEPEPGDGDAYHLGIDLILKYNPDAVQTSVRCPHCEKSNLVYFINHWTNTREYKDRRYALTELFCTRCGSGRIHGLFGRNDIEYYYLGIKDE